MFMPVRGGDSTLHRGSGDGLAPVLLASAKDASSASLQRLEHEYALRDELDASWAARPIALSRYNDRWALVLEDPGGEPLDRLLEGPLQTAEFLRLAVPLTNALRQMHERGLIHKDIKPGNILVHQASGGAWLTGFGIASRLPREHHPPAPPEVIAGTLAYMAPEQTGRMNRSVDSRSDLYSLGVSFYEMLTGRLPFNATDAMEWVHCHVARQTAPPDEHVPAIPQVLSAIVMKLLAKTAEDRYQTAEGLEADLQRCLTEWEAHGRMPKFPLGARDLSNQLLIPEKLYGRTREIDTLIAAFDRVLSRGTTELVLVSGYSGVGKSSIVNELHKALVPSRGLFAAGKFDQYQRDIPYATLAQAFQSIVRLILGEGEAPLGRWRGDLQEALGPNGALMITLVPELELIIGEQPPVADLSPLETQERFQMVLRQFVAVFARKGQPLVLFLDDLQWLDTATLDLLKELATHPDIHDLLLIGAFRDNEVGPAHPLLHTLDAIRHTRTGVHDILIAPLEGADLTDLVADTLRCGPAAAQPLGQLVHEKTLGNPFFAIQFLKALSEEHLLVFDAHETRWKWDLNRIHARRFTDNVIDLMVARLSRLPPATQDTLKRLACLGNTAGARSLAMALGKTETDIHAHLWDVVRLGLLLRTDDRYTFAHDRVQEAAYALIDHAERATFHLQIGRMLAAHTPAESREERAFEIVSQLNRGAALILSHEEREQVAVLNLIAGKRAKATTAYASALNYLIAGEALLPPDRWGRTYTLAFGLALHRAECAFLTGDPATAEQELAALSLRAGTTADLTAVTCLRVAVFMTSGASERAIEICLQCLQSLGIFWSSRPTDDEVEREYRQMRRQLGSRAIETLIDLPPMSEPDSRATMDVLAAFIPAAHWIDRNLYCLIIGRMTNLSLEHGNDAGSCIAYAYLGAVLGPHFGDHQSGYRFGKLALDLVEKRELDRFKHRVYAIFGCHVTPWMRHLRDARGLVRRAADASHESGDLTFEVFSRMNLTTNLLASGEPLEEVEREAQRALALAQKARYGLVVELVTGQLGLIRTLRGRTSTFGSSADSLFDEVQFEQSLESAPTILVCWHWIRKLQARLLAGETESAIAAAEKAERLLWTSRSFFETAEYHFHAALARAAGCDIAPPAARAQHLQALRVHHAQIAAWAENCPANFASRAALVSAEIARLEGRDLDSMRLYEQALQSARENGFVHNEALAHELASRFYAARDLTAIAQPHLRAARDSYMRWGAVGKVRQLEGSFPKLREEAAPPHPATTIDASVEHLELATVIKVSQAVSGEIVLEQLIDNLMRTALEHAGAERGLLIAEHDGLQQLEAEATTVRDAITVRLRPGPVSAAELPESILHYVIRTRQAVTLDDASVQGAYSEDPYVRRHRLRSVLCLPLIKQTALIGVLYLENNLAPGVFTPTRSAVLTLLASQAAISLENAYLYSDLRRANANLQQENSERRRIEEALRRSEAYLTAAQNLSHTGSFGWNISTGEIYWSEEAFRIFEYDPPVTPTVDRIMHERVHPEDAADFRQVVARASQNGQDFSQEYRLRCPSGRTKHLHVAAHAILSDAGGTEFVGAVMDITAAKQAEERARNNELELRVTIDTLPAFVLRGEGDGRPDLVSRGILDYAGLSKEDWLREGWKKSIHPEDLGRVLREWRSALAQMAPLDTEMRFRRADGCYRWFQARSVPLRGDDGHIVKWYSTIHDIEDRKRAEANLRQSESELRASEEQWRDVFENNPTMYFMVDAGGLILAVNPFGAEHLGYGVGELVGRAVLSVIHESDRDASQEHFDRCLAHLGRTMSWETRKICKDGKMLWVRETGKAVPRSNGTIVLMACEDITERKLVEAEKERLETQLRQSQKMEAMGTLAGGMAHDFNNILGAILGYGELAQQAVAERTDVRRYIDNVMQAGGRAKSLVERILAFSRSGLSERSSIDVQAVIEETLELLGAAPLAPGVRLETRLDAAGSAIIGDATQLHQVTMNLCTNALQAMENGGLLAVALDRMDVAQDRRLSHGTLATGAYVRLRLTDTGAGIPPPVLDRMFDPFFTTKSPGKGTGLGLSLVHGIVADLGGAIDVATAVGRGTTFSVWLPSAGAAVVPAAEPAVQLPHGRGQTVLIVDNEKPLVALAEEILAELGYEPVGFCSSVAALRAFRESPQRFDIVLTDEAMPELTGTALAAEIALLRPEAPIVLMSGFAGAQLHERARALGIRELLRKPLQRKDIAECFARVLPS
jgi:PAS domain S-box-containing protein